MLDTDREHARILGELARKCCVTDGRRDADRAHQLARLAARLRNARRRITRKGIGAEDNHVAALRRGGF